MLQWSPLASSIPITFLHDTPRYCNKKKNKQKKRLINYSWESEKRSVDAGNTKYDRNVSTLCS